MASELRVNTLKDASGNNSVATSVVFNGTAKAWVNGDTDASILDSTNVSSSSDIGTGHYQYNFTNSMANALYVGSGTSEGGATIFGIHQTNKTASSCQVRNVSHADIDSDKKHGLAIHGDLA
nr:hypothetical protein 29 [Alphaproteobacteria bacterium]